MVDVRAARGVLIAAGAYDGNPALDHLFEHRHGLVSAVPPSVTGDSLKLAGAAGAKIGLVPTPDFLGYHIPGEEQDGRPLWRAAMLECGFPHTMVVNRAGRRFGDESFYRSIGMATPLIEGGDQTQPNFPCWLILDSQYQQKYPLGSLLPGQDYPEGLATRADSRSRSSPSGSASTRRDSPTRSPSSTSTPRRASTSSTTGVRRPGRSTCAATARTSRIPTSARSSRGRSTRSAQQRLGTGMVAAGVVADVHSRALSYDDEPIAGLYVAGNAMARLDNGAGYQSGMMNGRGMVNGYLAARHAAGDASTALDASELSTAALP